MKKAVYLLGFIFLWGGIVPVSGQNETDVARYLQTDFSGTARVASMAGSFGALGGDLSTSLINPAGIGVYMKNEVEITPGMAFYGTDVSVLNDRFSENSGRFVFSNLALNYSGAPRSVNPTYFNFSMGYFRIKDFKYDSKTTILNNESSMLFDFTAQADGIPVEDLPIQTPFSSNLAWETFLIDEDTTATDTYLTQPRYEEDFPGASQKYIVAENGSMGEMFFNGAVAIQQRVYLGLTLGFTFGEFNQKTIFVEHTVNDSLLLDNFTSTYEQNSTINGINIKLGLIYKPEDWLRLGLAYHVPNRLQLTDEWFTTLRSQFKDGEFYSDKSPNGEIQYSLRKPGKMVFSAAVISGFNGLISLDVEWINYGNSEISSSGYNFGSENRFISQVMRNAFNVRIGGELWMGKFNIRAGYAYRQNAYKDLTPEIPKFFNTYAIGAGFLTQANFYLNISGNYKTGYREQSAYSPALAPVEHVNENMVEVLVSAGYRF